MKLSRLSAICLGILLLPGTLTVRAQSAVVPPLHFAPMPDAAKQDRILREGGVLATASDSLPEPDPTPLPSRYDLREQGLVTAVKDQGNYNTCWAFASLGCLETQQLPHDPLIDLSEWHLAFYTYSQNFGYPYAAATPFDAGSFDADQEIGILTGWMAPAPEEIAPYGSKALPDASLSMAAVQAQSVLHTTAAVSIPYGSEDEETFQAQIEAVKHAIYDGNALDMSYQQCDACYNAKYHSYCYYPTNAETYGHSSMIVGWDDAFPASQFNIDPGRDGAWLIRGSWGASWGDHGYFWMSYADPSLEDIYRFQAEPAGAHPKLYQHDCFGNSGAFSCDPGGEASVWIANVFTAELDGSVDAVMLCNLNGGDTAQITVYTGLPDAADPLSGTASETTEVLLPDVGYQTVSLTQAVQIRAGERFSVVARLSGAENGWRIPCEFATHTVRYHTDGTANEYDSGFTQEMLMRDFAPGQSFYSAGETEDGFVWYDMYQVPHGVLDYTDDATGDIVHVDMQEGNICLKALARDADQVIFSTYQERISAFTKITLSDPAGAAVYYAIDGGAYEPYTAPIRFPAGAETMTVSAYADTGARTVWQQSYQVEKASISSLLCTDRKACRYVQRDPEDETQLHCYVRKGITEVELLPISTGTVTLAEEEVPSGTAVTVPVRRGTTRIPLTVTQEGMTRTTYLLTVETIFSANFLRGDVNLDGTVNAADATDLLIYAAAVGAGDRPAAPDDEWLDRADYNEDDAINALDATEVLIYAAQAGAG